MRVVYGTGSHLIDFAEMLIPRIITKGIDGSHTSVFFFYPKGKAWMKEEEKLFEPYEVNGEATPRNVFKKDNEMAFMSLQGMSQEVDKIVLEDAADAIRKNRTIKSFIAVSVAGEKPVFVSGRDKKWKEWSQKTIQDILMNENVKLGGSFIYFLYGLYLARNSSENIGILPEKTKNDVAGSFWAGTTFFGGNAFVLPVGDLKIMTEKQWQMWAEDGKERKIPKRVADRFIESPIVDETREKIIEKKHCCINYNEEKDKFSFIW